MKSEAFFGGEREYCHVLFLCRCVLTVSDFNLKMESECHFEMLVPPLITGVGMELEKLVIVKVPRQCQLVLLVRMQ
jgi:hypothetical protein